MGFDDIYKILFPENIKHCVTGCLCVLFVTNGIIYAILRKLTPKHFLQYHLPISIIALFLLITWYFVYAYQWHVLRLLYFWPFPGLSVITGVIAFYVIPNWQPKPPRDLLVSKEYLSYYWLVTHIDPYRVRLNTAFFHYIKTSSPGVEVIHTVYPYPPDCLYTAIEEMGMEASHVFETLSLEISTGGLTTKEGNIRMEFPVQSPYRINKYEDDAYNYGCSKSPLQPLDILDRLFTWCIKKGICYIRDEENKEVIHCVEDIKKVWTYLKLESIDVYKIRVAHNNLLTEIMSMEFDLKCEVERYEEKLNNYFLCQHIENLKKLS